MAATKKAISSFARIAGFIIGAIVIIFVGGPLLHAAGQTTTLVAGAAGLGLWLYSLYARRSNTLSFAGWFIMAAAGFSVWLESN